MYPASLTDLGRKNNIGLERHSTYHKREQMPDLSNAYGITMDRLMQFYVN